MTKTNEDAAVVEVEDKKDILAEAKSLVAETRVGLRDLRLTGLGLWDKANAQTRQVVTNIKARSAEKLNEAQESAEDASFYDKAMAAFENSVSQARAYATASYEEATESTQQLSDWLTRIYNEAGTAVDASDEKPISRIGRSLEQTGKAFNRLAADVRESTEELLESAKQGGKDVDYELRKALFGRQSTLESRIQAFWNALGLVNKQEMAEVNRKLVVLAASLENQLDEESKTLVYLNRRKNDRRKKQVPVAFEKRLRDRREEDRLAS